MKHQLYKTDLIKPAPRIVLVGGYRSADALNSCNVPATSMRVGANAATTDWTPLLGKDVILWPNNDAPDHKGVRVGIESMKAAADAIGNLNPPPRIFWIDVDGAALPYGVNAAEVYESDLNEAVELRYSQSLFENLIESAIPLGASNDMAKLMADIAAGKMRTLEWPWPCLLRATRATMPGTVTLICGDPGATKSLWLLELFLHWHVEGRKVALFELEETRTYHLRRALAMLANDTRILDNDWCEGNPGPAASIERAHAAAIDSFGSRITENENDSITLTELGDWIEVQAIAGCAAIAIDPVTAAAGSRDTAEDDKRFVNRIKRIALKYSTRIFIITHPVKGGGSKGKGPVGMDALAGGTAYARFVQTIIWLDCPPKPQPVTVLRSPDIDSIPEEQVANRIFKVFKARNGRGGGAWIAMRFDGGNLRTTELGLIMKVGK